MPANWVLLKGCTQYASIWKTQQWPQDWKRSAFIPTPKKGNAKEHSNYCMIVLISHPGKVILKSLQARLNSMWTKSFQMFKLDLEKAEKPEIKLPTFVGSSKKAREFQKSIYFCFIEYAKVFDCIDHNKLWEILKEMGIPDHLTCLLRNLYEDQEATVRIGHRTMDWFQMGKKYIRAVYCHLAYLTYMQRTSCEMPDWMKHKLESRLLGEISITSDMPMTAPLW